MPLVQLPSHAAQREGRDVAAREHPQDALALIRLAATGRVEETNGTYVPAAEV